MPFPPPPATSGHPTIPFLDLVWPTETGSVHAVESCLPRHARKLAAARLPEDAQTTEWIELDPHMRSRTEDRARRYVECRDAQPNLASCLDRKDYAALERVRDGVRLAAIPSEHRADEIAADLHEQMPWMAKATERVWHAMRASVREGAPGLRLPPLLLVGDPGVGKSYWARRLAELIDTPTVLIDATGENTSFGVAGCQRGWSSA